MTIVHKQIGYKTAKKYNQLCKVFCKYNFRKNLGLRKFFYYEHFLDLRIIKYDLPLVIFLLKFGGAEEGNP